MAAKRKNMKRKIALLISQVVTNSDEENEMVFGSTSVVLHSINLFSTLTRNEEENRTKFKKDENRFQTYLNINNQLSDSSFTQHFRMSRTTFTALLPNIVRINEDTLKRTYIPYPTQLLMVLWILATPDSFRSIAKRFNVNKGTLHYIYVNMIKLISSLSKNYIKWPTGDEITKIKTKVEKDSGFSGVVGFIDGMYVNIKCPTDPTRYFNRKKDAALILQGVCDDQLRFTDVYFGEVGSLHDSRVFSRSPLSNAINENSAELFGENGHLIGDSAYTLSCHMLTPFRNNGHLLDEQIHYNFIHASIRKAIERAFALLKGKWRRLKYLDASKFKYIRDHVIACCVLHNFILLQNCALDIIELLDEEVVLEADTEISQGINTEACQKRNLIAAILYDKQFCQ